MEVPELELKNKESEMINNTNKHTDSWQEVISDRWGIQREVPLQWNGLSLSEHPAKDDSGGTCCCGHSQKGTGTKWNKDFILQIVLYTIIFLKFLLRGFLNETPTAFSVIPFLLATWNHDNSTANKQKNSIQPAKLCWLKSTRENHNKSPTCQLKTTLQINHFVLWEKDLCVICSHHCVQQLRGRWVRNLF